ncbi:hypothetical protein E2C01_089184 [Portunus trituberculatus]|uniref:Uncharacterized protein n=1 Tax=Portunus trituberculatus TaxID=210409 RepID=A0A5B7JCU3_PORTR|nr:hypothetical protein [Portunus trituberculatus]
MYRVTREAGAKAWLAWGRGERRDDHTDHTLLAGHSKSMRNGHTHTLPQASRCEALCPLI